MKLIKFNIIFLLLVLFIFIFSNYNNIFLFPFNLKNEEFLVYNIFNINNNIMSN